MKVYLNDEKISVDPRRLYDILLGLKALCAKGRTISKVNYDFLNSPKKRTKLTILSKGDAQDSEFRSFFGRIKDTISCFQDLLTSNLNYTQSVLIRNTAKSH